MTWNSRDEEEEEDWTDLDEDWLRDQVANSLNYLVTEGMVVQVGDRYRIKTEEEKAQELRDIEEGKHDNN